MQIAEAEGLCSRTIPCPKGTDRPACETVLLHREDFKIPEKMARFAVRHGMAGFVKKMGAGVHPFVEARRLRVDKVRLDAALCNAEQRCLSSLVMQYSSDLARVKWVGRQAGREAGALRSHRG